MNSNWENYCIADDRNAWNDLTDNDMKNVENPQEDVPLTDSDSENDTDIEDNNINNITAVCDETSQNIQLETCVQPADLSIDASRIMPIAPGEGKKPLAILQDDNFEELSFQTLFPTGKCGYNYQRQVHLTPKKYFQRRILEQSGRFASNIEYLFVAQFITEWHQITASISVALRKSLTGTDGESFNAGFFKHHDHIRPLITKDDAYHFLRSVMYELLAAIKQFKIFT